MIKVKTKEGKRALAGALSEHHPEYLEDLKMFGEAFGPLAALTYEADDPDQQARVLEAYQSKVTVEHDKSRARALSEIAKAKEATK